SARAALRVPSIFVVREWAQHFRRHVLRCQHQAGIRREMRHGHFAITHHDGAALRRLTEKQLREIKRQAYATVAGRVTGQIARVHGNASPGQPLHVWHGRIVVLLRIVLLFFLKDAEDAARCGVALRAGAHARATDEDAVTINVHGLLWDAHEHHERTAWRELRFPPILARLEYAGRFSGRRAFSMSRRLFDRLRGGEQSDGESDDFQDFHEMIREVNYDWSRNPPHYQ